MAFMLSMTGVIIGPCLYFMPLMHHMFHLRRMSFMRRMFRMLHGSMVRHIHWRDHFFHVPGVFSGRLRRHFMPHVLVGAAVRFVSHWRGVVAVSITSGMGFLGSIVMHLLVMIRLVHVMVVFVHFAHGLDNLFAICDSQFDVSGISPNHPDGLTTLIICNL